ncbi:MAG: hypothetical protein K2K96_05620 [Lachnospiraceae bacterium]|nr:hypothetical protein [Lachnospiraceae bacterium]
MSKSIGTEMYIKVKPNKLYPLTTIDSVVPHTLQKTVELLTENIDIHTIKSFVYNGNMYMLDGSYEMLAANILNKENVDVEIIDRTNIPFWNIDENIEKILQAIGISALYDFEAIGEFTYENYPAEYKGR